MWPRTHRSAPFDTWLTRILTIIQIVAIPAAAYWAFTRFHAEDAPALEHRAKIRADLSWRERSKNECTAEFKVSFENIGKSSIDLMEAFVSAYPLDVAPLSDKTIAYVDPNELIERLTPLLQADIRGYLWDRFPPGVADEVGAMFTLRKDPGKMIIFRVQARSAVSDTLVDWFWPWRRNKELPWSWHRWDYVCGESGVQFPTTVN
jgi:hypothetical protein